MILEAHLSPETPMELETLSRQAFAVLAGMEPEAVYSDPAQADPAPLPESFTSVVSYDDGATGTMVVQCSPALAYTFTRHFLSGSNPGHFDEDVRDALGELANTVGGNYKGLLSTEVTLTTPEVFASATPPAAFGALTPLCRVALSFPEGTCLVTLARANAGAA